MFLFMYGAGGVLSGSCWVFVVWCFLPSRCAGVCSAFRGCVTLFWGRSHASFTLPLLFPCVLGCSPGGPIPMSFLMYALCSVFLTFGDVFPPFLMCRLCAGVVPCRVHHALWGLSVVVSDSPCGVVVESFISCGRCRVGCAELRLFRLHVLSCVCLWERFSRYVFPFVFHGVQ